MSDTAAAGSFHVTVDADVRIAASSRLAGVDEGRLAELLADLVRRHAREAGLEITDPQSVRAQVVRQD